MLLPSFMIGPDLSVEDLRGAFRPWSNVWMLQHAPHGMRDPLWSNFTEDERTRLRSAWGQAIHDHPGAWLSHRWAVTKALFGTHSAEWPRELIYVPQEFHYRDNPEIGGNDSMLHRVLLGTAEAMRSCWPLAAWPYLLCGLMVAPGAWCRRGSATGVSRILLLSAWLYAVPLVFVAPAAEVRYLGWSCVASLLAAALVAADFLADRFGKVAPVDPPGSSGIQA
jgi:hypothetical protein